MTRRFTGRTHLWLAAFFLAAAVLCLSTSLYGSEITAAIQKQYQTIRSFRTEFTQTLYNAASKEKEVRQGWIAFQKPRNIHWETNTPEKELLIVNEACVWDYFPEEKVAYRYGLKEIFSSKTMLRFITGEVNIDEDFGVERMGTEENGLIELKLVPNNPEPSLVEARVWVEPKTHLLRKIELTDFFSNTNTIRFENIAIDPELDPSLFSFEPPEGVEIMDNQGVQSSYGCVSD